MNLIEIYRDFVARLEKASRFVAGHAVDQTVAELIAPAPLAVSIANCTSKELAELGIYADALRVIENTITMSMEIDEPLSDQHLEASKEFYALVAAKFAKTRPGYAPFSSLTQKQINEFRQKYRKDDGPFGYRNEVFKWTGHRLSRRFWKQGTSPDTPDSLTEATIFAAFELCGDRGLATRDGMICTGEIGWSLRIDNLFSSGEYKTVAEIQNLLADYPDEHEAMFERIAELIPSSPLSLRGEKRCVVGWIIAAQCDWLSRRDRVDEADRAYETAIRMARDDDDFEEGIDFYTSYFEMKSRHGDERFAEVLKLLSEYETSAETSPLRVLARLVELLPETPCLLNLLAKAYAFSSDDETRDGARAVRLAEAACRLVDFERYEYLETLAAAYAETGDFDSAVTTILQAEGGVPQVLRIIHNREEFFTEELASYRSKKKFA